MSLTKKGYIKRLIDDKLSKYLEIFGAVSIEGPKWCGKTWTSLNHANSVSYVSEKEIKNLAKIDPKYIFTHKFPQVIDEWQIVPGIWDAVRHECDSDGNRGKFILTGSTTLNSEEKNEVFHSGTGRIALMRMYPMSLYESKDSSGDVSILDMSQGKINETTLRKIELEEIASFIIRGGWPQNLNTKISDISLIPESYIESIINKDMHERTLRKRNPNKMRILLRALARNESTVVSLKKLINDTQEYENERELIKSRDTLQEYINVLDSLYITSNQEAYSLNYRSSARVGKSIKRHLVDPSLSCACLGLTVDKLMRDHETFGFMFEGLVERDLKIYANYLDAHVFYFRENVSGDEVDAIMEFKDGSYGAFEIKLTYSAINDALKSLTTFYKNVKRKPSFMCVIVGYLQHAYQDKETGIFIVPITSLRP